MTSWTSRIPTLDDLEKAFAVYFEELESGAGRPTRTGPSCTSSSRCPDICGALESENGWAPEKKYVDWCGRYWCAGDGVLSPEDYRDIRNFVLHQAGASRRQADSTSSRERPVQAAGSTAASSGATSSCSMSASWHLSGRRHPCLVPGSPDGRAAGRT